MKKLLPFLAGSLLAARVVLAGPQIVPCEIVNAATGVAAVSTCLSPQLFGYLDRVQVFLDEPGRTNPTVTATGVVAVVLYTNSTAGAFKLIYTNAAYTESTDWSVRFPVANWAGTSLATTGGYERLFCCGDQFQVNAGSFNATNKNVRVRFILDETTTR